MIGSFVNNIRSRLTSRVSDVESMNISIHSTDGSKSTSLLDKFLNASYSLVSQHQDDAYCSNNVFMLPRAYTEPCRSPISLKPSEKSLDELDNIVDKFVRCISLENDYDCNVHFAHPSSIHTIELEIKYWLIDLFLYTLLTEEKWSWSNSSTTCHGWGGWLFGSSTSTYTKTKFTVAPAKRYVHNPLNSFSHDSFANYANDWHNRF